MIEIQEFEQMFDASPLAQAIVDKNLKFVKINAAFVRLFGFSMDRILAMKITDLKTQGLITYRKDTGKSIQDVLAGKTNEFGESTFEGPTGVHVIQRAFLPLLDEKREVRYIFITYNEISLVVKSQEYLEQEINEFIRVYEKMATGDLTVSHSVEKPEDKDLEATYEILARLRGSVRNIIAALKVNIKDVNRQMADLTTITNDATHSVEDASKGVDHIAKNTSIVSDSTRKVSEGIGQMTQAMQDMSAAVEEISSSMESVSTQAHNANSSARSGAQLAEGVNHNMSEITGATNNVYGIVKDIEKQMNDIGKIIVLIRDLASQTNLLALNAAIEAARAGEHGRGFAVVASEVKSLAQESRQSAEKIEDMIKQLNSATKKAMDAMDGSKILVQKGFEESQAALDAFRQIQKAAEAVANSASEVAAATEEQAATTEEITASVHEVSSLIDKTAKEAGDAAAATEESAAAISDIARIVRTVNESAVQAMEANKKFRVD